jgi:UDP-glucuronate 4-epimerase
MAVLVTGGAGFIGSHVCDRFLAQGHTVICVDDFNDFYDPALKWQNIRQAQASPRFHLHQISITDTPAMADVFAQHSITQVVHLAARAGVRPSIGAPGLYEQVNVQATLHLLDLCREHSVERFIFGSSSSVYGAQARHPFREDDPADRPISPYAATKRAGELLAYTYHHLYGLPVVCLRFFTVYGPRQRPDLAIHKFTRAIYDGQEITLYGKGDTARDYTFVDDIVGGIVAALECQPAPGFEIINLGNSTPITLRDLIAVLERTSRREARIRHDKEQPGDVPFTCADITKARTTLNWRPTTPLEEGVQRFVDWFEMSRSMPQFP